MPAYLPPPIGRSSCARKWYLNGRLGSVPQSRRLLWTGRDTVISSRAATVGLMLGTLTTTP